jgi:FMN phosphatase YigB (HAD superfamily)
MANLIFHLNILADTSMIRTHYQLGLSQMLGERFGNQQKWFNAYAKILPDWDAYHTDLNFSGEDGMADMREARFRIMRALFRLVDVPEPSLDEIHSLADEALSKAHLVGDIFLHETHHLLEELSEKHIVSLVAYFPQKQLEAMGKGSHLHTKIQHFIGADTFEQYEMNQDYFAMLLKRLNAKPDDCVYVDKQTQVIESAAQVGLKTFLVPANTKTRDWWQKLMAFLNRGIQ